MLRVVVCVSGGGTNLQAMIDGIKEGRINNAGIVRVISNNRDAYALKRAEENHIPGVCISPKDYADREAFHKALLEAVREAEPDLIIRQEKLRRMAEKMQRVLSVPKINAYVKTQLGEKRELLASQFPLKTAEDFVKIIYIRLYGQRKNMDYTVELNDYGERNGYRFKDFLIRLKK